LFSDHETTGLAGGTGTYPFLVGNRVVGCGRPAGSEQFFMRESRRGRFRLLLRLSERMHKRRVLVIVQREKRDLALLVQHVIMA